VLAGAAQPPRSAQKNKPARVESMPNRRKRFISTYIPLALPFAYPGHDARVTTPNAETSDGGGPGMTKSRNRRAIPLSSPARWVGIHLALDALRHTTTPSLLSPISTCGVTVGLGPPTAIGSALSFCPTTRYPIQLVVAGGAPDFVADCCARTPARSAEAKMTKAAVNPAAFKNLVFISYMTLFSRFY